MMRREGNSGIHSKPASIRPVRYSTSTDGFKSWPPKNLLLTSLLFFASLLLLSFSFSHRHLNQPPPSPTVLPPQISFIIQGDRYGTTRQAVIEAGGKITHELPLIRAVAAELTQEQAADLKQHPAVSNLHGNSSVQSTWNQGLDLDQDSDQDSPEGSTEETVEEEARAKDTSPGRPYTEFPRRVRADLLHEGGLTGAGVTVAILDSGMAPKARLLKNSRGVHRLLAYYDARQDSEAPSADVYGHGSHIASVLANSARARVEIEGQRKRLFNGTAPDVDLVIVKAFGRHGKGTYADVIRGIQWILDHQNTYGIRILNLSFGAQPRSFYWDDPLNQAVMEAWSAGLFVVTAAGNAGPEPMTITVPGNLPYVMTVGAMSDGFTPDEPSDDYLTSFTAAGPTAEGFVKPDLVAPGAHMLGRISARSTLAREFPERWNAGYFELSGTSQATAVVSGIAALILQAKPWLQPDELKCSLMASGQAAIDPQGQLAYGPLQQGTGLVDAYRALNQVQRCANRGLSIYADLFSEEHKSGPVRLDDEGQFHIPEIGYTWDGSYSSNGATWSGGNPYLNGDPWIDGQGDPWIEGQGDPWIEGQANPWLQGDPWIEGQLWNVQNPWLDSSGDPWIEGQGDPWIDTHDWEEARLRLDSSVEIMAELIQE